MQFITIFLIFSNFSRFLNGFQNKIPHPYVGKTLNSLKAGTTLTKPTDIIYSHQMESNKNRFKENFAQSETNETNAKRREILDDILAPSTFFNLITFKLMASICKEI